MNLFSIGITSAIIYLIIKLIESFLHDFKYVFFLSSKSILKAVIIADIYAIFNNHVIKSIGTYDIILVDIVTVVCVSISIWASMTYSQKNLKEYIYTYEITTKYPHIRFELKDKFKALNIPYEYQYYYFENDKNNEEEIKNNVEINQFGESLYHKYTIHCFTKSHREQLEKVLNQYDYKDVKYIKNNTSHYIEKKGKNEEKR